MKKDRREPLREPERLALLAACRTGLEAIAVGLLLETGIRISELCALARDDVDWERGVLVIVAGKGGKRRTVPLSPRARDLLSQLFAFSGDGFPRSVRAVERIVKMLGRRAGIGRPCTPHILRHTFAVKCLSDGVRLENLRKILGHENLETTGIYLNVADPDLLRDFTAHWR